MDVVAEWDLPEPNPFGAALAAVEVTVSDGDQFATLPEVSATEVQQIRFTRGPGDWLLRLVVRDAEGRRSDPVDTPFRVPDTAPPGSVLNVRVTIL